MDGYYKVATDGYKPLLLLQKWFIQILLFSNSEVTINYALLPFVNDISSKVSEIYSHRNILLNNTNVSLMVTLEEKSREP